MTPIVLNESDLPDLEIDELIVKHIPHHPIEEFIDLMFEMEPESCVGIIHDDDALELIHRLNKSISAHPIDLQLVRKDDIVQLELDRPCGGRFEMHHIQPLFTLSRSEEDKVVSLNILPEPSLLILDLGPKIIAHLHSDKETLCILARTNLVMKSLTVPLLYQVVDIQSSRALHGFISTISGGHSHLGQYVQEVKFQNIVPYSLHTLLDCPHLKRLTITEKPTTSSLLLIFPSTVTMLSSDPAHFHIGEYYSFENLTHLHFVRTLTKNRLWFWLKRAHLPSLRYLIMQHTDQAGQFQDLVHKIIPKLGHLPSNPDLHILLQFPRAVLYSLPSIPTQETLDLVDGIIDSRLIIVAHKTGEWPERIRNRIMDPDDLGEFDGPEASGVLWKQVERAVEERALTVKVHAAHSTPTSTERPYQMVNYDLLAKSCYGDSASDEADTDSSFVVNSTFLLPIFTKRFPFQDSGDELQPGTRSSRSRRTEYPGMDASGKT
ncbi:hypothetical protein DL96DRAFT_1616668 [Flagelloscypha sp. PMI_526]|nr:hypothetical protein DL96DRAFT_1616668 [Flagelloscypha sp. PMI_526]